MKLTALCFAACSLLAMATPAHSIPHYGGAVSADLTATFDALDPLAGGGSVVEENGIRVSSPNGISAIDKYFAAVCFGGGGYTYTGNALLAPSNGWVGISAPGSLLSGVAFSYGFDWDFYAIEYGLLETTFEWQAWRGDVLLATSMIPRLSRHGGVTLQITDDGIGFDRLLVRSTALAWNGIWNPQTGSFDRGAMIGYGDANRLALDTVRVQLAAPVPDQGQTATLLLSACAALFAVRSFLARTRGFSARF